jgi:hypothetical protein
VHGSMCRSVFCNRHSLQVTRMRPVPSHSGNAEEKRPPGEINGSVRTGGRRGGVQLTVQAVTISFCVAACSATVAGGVAALFGSVGIGLIVLDEVLASMICRLPPKSALVNGRASASICRRPSRAGARIQPCSPRRRRALAQDCARIGADRCGCRLPYSNCTLVPSGLAVYRWMASVAVGMIPAAPHHAAVVAAPWHRTSWL